MSLIKDRDQFNEFVNNILPPLKNGECYFLSLSARNKYLSEDERKFYQLGRTEMFSRTLCYGDWDYAIKKLESALDYKQTKSGHKFPSKCLVVYVNINPSNVVLAASRFAQTVQHIQSEIIRSYINNKQPNLKSLDKAPRLLMNEIQKSAGTKVWLDIDLDSKQTYFYTILKNELDNNSILHKTIETKGGFHFMINRNSFAESGYKNLYRVVNDIHASLGEYGECKFNKNNMTPMPGTLQADFLVRII